MTDWETKIINVFINHYYASAHEIWENRKVLRLRSSLLFPDFDSAHPDEKESYLEAAESLQMKGIVKLRWEKHAKWERLRTLSCDNFELLFKEAGALFPQKKAENIRTMLSEIVEVLKKTKAPLLDNDRGKKIIGLLEFLSLNFAPHEVGQGLDRKAMRHFAMLLEFMLQPEQMENIGIRALSILLYRDSKRLESLLTLCGPLLSRVEKNVPIPDLSFLERSYPETMIAGKIIIQYKNQETSLVNAGGYILGLPLESAEAIDTIQLVSGQKEKTVLTIENKETFYTLARPQRHGTSEFLSMFDCFLYVGGYSNRASAEMIKKLTMSNFTFYHAGDLDPDGILILQHIHELAGRPVTPLRMNAATFNQYQDWARLLTKPMLRQIEKIREETRNNPDLAGLLRRIEETGMGVEQEIIDYR
ncbi:MAG: DUF2220 domain-containing protein [Treponema sp.]|jgi:hypothetical protein|nr:DUF2220 domain-containing protein [Treponema sp.]